MFDSTCEKAELKAHVMPPDVASTELCSCTHTLISQDALRIAGGENVYSSEVEAVLSAHPQVQQAAVFGVPNTVMGEMVHAAVVLQPSAAPVTSQELIKWCHASLAAYKCPTTVHLMPELPLTGSGKVLKTALKAALASGGPKRAVEATQHGGIAQRAGNQTPATTSANTGAAGRASSVMSSSAVIDVKAAAAAAPAAGALEPVVSAHQLETLVTQFAQEAKLPMQTGVELDAARCYLLVVPDWADFIEQVGSLKTVTALSCCICIICLAYTSHAVQAGHRGLVLRDAHQCRCVLCCSGQTGIDA